MKEGHEFPVEHGFTGSAIPRTNFKPVIPGVKKAMTPKAPKMKLFNKLDTD